MKSSSKEGWVSMLSQEMQIAFKHITFTGQFVRCLHDFSKKFISWRVDIFDKGKTHFRY